MIQKINNLMVSLFSAEQKTLPLADIYTFFHFSEKADWNNLKKQLVGYIDDYELGRLELFFPTKPGYTIIIERHYIDKDYRDTFCNFYAKKFVTPDARTIRLHFFTADIHEEDLYAADEEKLQRNYFGYSVLRPTKPNHLGRTLVHYLPLLSANDYPAYGMMCTEKVHLQGVKLIACGFPFISQDTDVTSCAESTIWMLLRYYSNKHACYKECYPFEIAQWRNNSSQFERRAYHTKGLTIREIENCLRIGGFCPLVYDRESISALSKKGSDADGFVPNDLFLHILYAYVESGFPVILEMRNFRHVILAVGHQVQKREIEEYKNDYSFTSDNCFSLLINDDNYFPYQILQIEESKQEKNEIISKYSLKDVTAFIVPSAEKIFLSAEKFLRIVKTILASSNAKLQQFNCKNNSPLLKRNKVILRTFVTTGKAFKSHLLTRGASPEINWSYLNMPLPHFIWVCELATPDSICENKIWGEIIWDATNEALDSSGILAIHYPEVLFINEGSVKNNSPSIQQCALKNEPVAYNMYRNNLEEIHE